MRLAAGGPGANWHACRAPTCPAEYLTFQKIVAAEYTLPEGLPPAAADLIARLLQTEPADRIGAWRWIYI